MFPALAADGAVQVEDHIDAALLGLIDHAVEVLPRIGAQVARMLSSSTTL
jgi:hypothetical protein